MLILIVLVRLILMRMMLVLGWALLLREWGKLLVQRAIFRVVAIVDVM